ncbi:hypothetical protein DV736_g1932, partial [Chaetothyriales sp. CBS 134916]
MDPEFEDQSQTNGTYHEMDFTYLHPASISSSRLPKYSTSMEMDDDDLSGLRPSRIGYLADSEPGSTSVGLNPAGFSYSQQLTLDSTPSSLPSLCTSSRADSSSSEQSISAVGTSPDEKICPLITGETDICNPDRCGPDAPCMNFTNIPPIEECTDVPCMTAPEEENPKTPKPSRVSEPSKRSKLTRQPSSDRLFPRTQLSSRKSTGDSNESSAVARKAGAGKTDAKSRAKQAHSLVEKKYRENLNAKLLQLHDTLRVAQYGPKRYRDLENDNDSDEFASNNNSTNTNASSNGKFRKGEVLDDALDYVNQTEVEMRHMENEIHRLADLVGILERRLKYEDVRGGGRRMLGSLMAVGPG